MAYYESNHYYPPPTARPFHTRSEYLEAIAHEYNIHHDYLYNHFGSHLPIMIFNMALDACDWIEMYRMVHDYKFDINAPSRYGSPPIWHEVSCGTLNTVQQLILLGARLNIVNHETQQSLLDLAYVKNFNRTKHLLMAYNAKSYKVLFPKIQPTIINVAVSTDKVSTDKVSKEK